MIALYKECLAYNKSLEYKPVEGYYDGEYKQGELLDLSVFPDEVKNAVADNWGQPVSMERDFSIEEILDMPTEGETKMDLPLANIDCVGQDDICKVVSQNNFVTPKIEPDYIETDNESHSGEIPRELFCVPGNDSDYIDIDDLY